MFITTIKVPVNVTICKDVTDIRDIETDQLICNAMDYYRFTMTSCCDETVMTITSFNNGEKLVHHDHNDEVMIRVSGPDHRIKSGRIEVTDSISGTRFTYNSEVIITPYIDDMEVDVSGMNISVEWKGHQVEMVVNETLKCVFHVSTDTNVSNFGWFTLIRGQWGKLKGDGPWSSVVVSHYFEQSQTKE